MVEVVIIVNIYEKYSKSFCTDMPGCSYSTVDSTTDSRVRGPGFDTRSGHILMFLLLLIQEGQLSVTGESVCSKYWLTA